MHSLLPISEGRVLQITKALLAPLEYSWYHQKKMQQLLFEDGITDALKKYTQTYAYIHFSSIIIL